jgi:hypothetical protein
MVWRGNIGLEETVASYGHGEAVGHIARAGER